MKTALDFQLYADYFVDNGVSKRTAKTYISCLKVFFHGGSIEDPTTWYRNFVAQGKSSSYQHNMYFAIRWLMRYHGIDWKYKKPKLQKKVRQNLSLEKCWALLESITNPEHKLLIETAIMTGLRPSELLALKKDDIDLFENTITIKNTKTYCDRIITIDKALATKLQYHIFKKNIRDKIFPLCLRTYQDILTREGKKLGFKVTPYMLRHTFATQYVENGGNLLMLKSILGHSNIKTTEGYVHESKAMLRKDYERAKPRLFV
jgi:integrase/recombinase XerD